MFAAVPPRRRSRRSTRNETLSTWAWSARMWSAKRPGKTMMVSKATEPVTAMEPMGGKHREPARPDRRRGENGQMALPRARPAPGPGTPLSEVTSVDAAQAEAVEVYRRTYTTVLRSSGETRLRVLEASHKAMHSSLHSLADSTEPDLGAFLYATRRLPDSIVSAGLVVMGQSAEIFARHGFGTFATEMEIGAPGRRRRWYDDGRGTLAVLIASASDVDDLIPTLVAFQIEWNKLGTLLGAATDVLIDPTPAGLAG